MHGLGHPSGLLGEFGKTQPIRKHHRKGPQGAPIPYKDDRRVVHLPTTTETPRDWEVWLTVTNKWRGGQSNSWSVPKTLGILTSSGGWYDPTTVTSRSNIPFWTGAPGIIFPPLWLIGALAVVLKLRCEASLVLPPDAAWEYRVSMEWRGPDNSAQLRARPDRGSGVSGSTIVAPCLHKGDLVYRPRTPLHNGLPSLERAIHRPFFLCQQLAGGVFGDRWRIADLRRTSIDPWVAFGENWEPPESVQERTLPITDYLYTCPLALVADSGYHQR